jgi:hypothetical protein
MKFEEVAGRKSSASEFLELSPRRSKHYSSKLCLQKYRLRPRNTNTAKYFTAARSPPPSRRSRRAEYVAQQPTHIRRLLRDCDLRDRNAEVSFVDIPPGPFNGGTDGGLLNGWVLMVLFGEHLATTSFTQSVRSCSPSLCPPRGGIVWFTAALTHLRLVVEYYVIIPNNNRFVAFIAIAGALARCRTNTSMDLVLQVPHGLRSRSRDTYLHSEVANPHYVALQKGHATGKHPTIYIP